MEMERTYPADVRRSFKLRKWFALVGLLCLTILSIYLYIRPKPSSYSDRPDRIPRGIVLEPIMINGLEADFFHGSSSKPQKALVLLGGSEGGRYWSYQPNFIQTLIEQGYCVLSLPYFGAGNLPTDLRSVPLEYFSKAFQWLSMQKNLVYPNDFALVGLSRGAELALLLGSRYPEVKAVVAIDPSSVVFPGPPIGFLDLFGGEHSAWSEKGYELPFVPIPYTWTTLKGMLSGKRTRMFEKALLNTSSVKAAAIPAEKIQGPILLVSFTRDQVWPSTFMSEQIMERLHNNSFHFHYEHTAFEGSHSEWSTEPCRTKILYFLKQQFGN